MSHQHTQQKRVLMLEPATSARFIDWLRERMLSIRVAATGEPLGSQFPLMQEHCPGNHTAESFVLFSRFPAGWKLPGAFEHIKDYRALVTGIFSPRPGINTMR